MSRWCRWERTPGLIDFPIEDDRTIVGRHVIDVTDRSNPSILGELPLSHPVVAKVKDNLAFVTTEEGEVDRLLILDLEAAPALMVTTNNATSITTNSASLNGCLNDLGTASRVDVSFEWGFRPGGLDKQTTLETRSEIGTFTAEIDGLARNTTYYFRAKAIGDGETVYGEELSFKTLDVSPGITSRLLGSLDLPSRVSGNFAICGNIVLIATDTGALVVDVADRESPSILGSIPVEGGCVRNVEFKDVNLGCAFSDRSLYTIDTSDPGAIHSPSWVWVGGYRPIDFDLSDDYAIVLVDRLYYNQLTKLSVVNVTDSHNPTIISSPELPSVYGGDNIEVIDDIGFVVSEGGLHIFDFTDLSHPERLTSVGAVVGGATGVEIYDNFAYILTRSGDIINLAIYDVSQPGAPRFLQIVEGVASADE